ncbi:MAG: TlpA family protein disulfide reductase, partial [Pirellulales bacterium]|nr:TlpA family protein disulfide reductase [Pirellulales bacterium]
VVIQYWTTSRPLCKADHAVLGDLYKKYGGSRGFEIIGVNLDFVRNDLLSYLKANRLPWKQLHEPGGFDSRLASELGVVTVPLMLLVGEDGLVISNNIQAAEIEAELKKLLLASRKKTPAGL